MRRWAVLLVVGAAVLPSAACSDPEPDQVVIDAGSVPPEATATSAPPASDAPPATDSPVTDTEPIGPPALTDSSLVTTAGIDDVAFGMSVAEVERAAGSRLSPVESDPDDACYFATFDEGPTGLEILIVDGNFERLDIVDGTITTRSGAGIGDTSAQLTELFGEQLEDGADPDGEGQALTYVPSDESDRGTLIIFTMDGDTVASYRAGRTPMVNTGC